MTLKKQFMSKNLKDRIILLKDSDLCQGFDSKEPYFNLTISASKYSDTQYVDPFLCYTHNIELVSEIANICEKRFPIDIPPHYFILPLEFISRTNGFCSSLTQWNDSEIPKKQAVNHPIIGLCGKRICIHPAMTRYLVAHEYGHAVNNFICKKKEILDNEFDELYSKMRGIPYNNDYGARKWHTNIGEIIANDFRIAVCNIESEFWQHEVTHPKDDLKVNMFWSDIMMELT